MKCLHQGRSILLYLGRPGHSTHQQSSWRRPRQVLTLICCSLAACATARSRPRRTNSRMWHPYLRSVFSFAQRCRCWAIVLILESHQTQSYNWRCLQRYTRNDHRIQQHAKLIARFLRSRRIWLHTTVFLLVSHLHRQRSADTSIQLPLQSELNGSVSHIADRRHCVNCLKPVRRDVLTEMGKAKLNF